MLNSIRPESGLSEFGKKRSFVEKIKMNAMSQNVICNMRASFILFARSIFDKRLYVN